MTIVTSSAVPVHVVWFKRDLRVSDHRPLLDAAARGPVIPLYVYEPSLINQPTSDARHIAFSNECLSELDTELRRLGAPLVYRHGDIVSVLNDLHRQHGISSLWAHQETTDLAGYVRDNEVRGWCAEQGVAFVEHLDRGVFRRQKTRDGWSKRWRGLMTEAVAAAPERIRTVSIETQQQRNAAELGLSPTGGDARQLGGRKRGLKVLDSFLSDRAEPYATAMSSPVSAFDHSSRLSPYLAFGTLSGREVHQATLGRIDEVKDMQDRGLWLKSLRAFDKRLHWRDHFTQKLEDQPTLEVQAMHPMLEAIRSGEVDGERLEAFRDGRTGYPMVDACMRATVATGWLNFRMRAMIVSFASYHLWLDWRPIAHYLATQWTDYEPGIHYPQHQMQAGVTGINALRIYSPTKQVHDHDPTGTFIRAWVPELESVPDEFIAEPSLMPPDIQTKTGFNVGHTYPLPIVDHQTATRAARRIITDIKSTPEAKAISDAIVERHGSRRPRPRRRS